MNTPTSLLHVTDKLTKFCLYAIRPSASIDLVPVDENAIGPVQSIVFSCGRGGNGVTARPTVHSKAHNHATLFVYILLI